MPNYNFLRKSTGETWTDFMTMSQMADALAADKDLDVVPVAVPCNDGFKMGVRKADNHSHFKDVMKEIKKRHPLNTIQSSDY